MAQKVVIIGAGGFAREVLDIFDACNKVGGDYEVLGYIVESKYGEKGEIINGKPILGDFDWFERNDQEIFAVCGVGAPEHKFRLTNIALALGVPFNNVIHPSAILTDLISIGDGVIIAAGCILTNQIQIGNHVHINLDSTIGHDCIIEEFTTIAPGVHVSGRVTLGKGTYIGTGSAIIERLNIGEWSVIGAGSVVVRDIAPNTTSVGIPAKVIKERDRDWHLQVHQE